MITDPWDDIDYLVMRYEKSQAYEDRLALIQDYAIPKGVTQQAVIAKLSSLGVYEKKQYTDKHNKIPVSRDECAAALQVYLGIDLPSLAKLSKRDMLRLMRKLREIELDYPPYDTLGHWEEQFLRIVDDID